MAMVDHAACVSVNTVCEDVIEHVRKYCLRVISVQDIKIFRTHILFYGMDNKMFLFYSFLGLYCRNQYYNSI